MTNTKVEISSNFIKNLIQYHYEQNESAFKSEALGIAKELEKLDNSKLSDFIVSQIASNSTSTPQVFYKSKPQYLEKISLDEDSPSPFPIPDEIQNELKGLINNSKHQNQSKINKFLFRGSPGTGKTESVKHLARILNKDLFIVKISSLVDSKLGQTSKNIDLLFQEIKNKIIPEKSIVLFDEIDALALDRINIKDNREMGRATTAVLKGLDHLDTSVLLIATTNLYDHFDAALLRRFNYTINFDKYSKDDLVEVAEAILNYNITNVFKNRSKDTRLFKKIVSLMDPIKHPGDLKNIIISALAFSDPDNKFDYLGKVYTALTNNKTTDLYTLDQLGFSVKEIEKITGIDKSQVSIELQDKSN